MTAHERGVVWRHMASPETDMALERLKHIDIRKLEGGTKANMCTYRTRNRFLLNDDN